jgi:hypothetical protein
MKEIQAIGVYCSSYDSVNDVYKKAAESPTLRGTALPGPLGGGAFF